MLPENVSRAVAHQIRQAEQRLLEMIEQDRVRQEPDMTSRLVHGIEIASEEVDGVDIEFIVIDGIGPGSAERTLGADVLGVIRVELDDVRVAKGFLAQSKRSGADGVRVQAPTTDRFGHWLYRGDIQLEPSGVVQITRPSIHLDEQCENMLKVSPSSYVLVFSDFEVSVVSASAVHAHRASKQRVWKDLGTKRLDDFFLHAVDCFIGDSALAAASVAELRIIAEREGVSSAMMLRVVGQSAT